MGIEELTTGGTVRPITRWGESVMHAQTRQVTAFDDDLAFDAINGKHGAALALVVSGDDLDLVAFLDVSLHGK